MDDASPPQLATVPVEPISPAEVVAEVQATTKYFRWFMWCAAVAIAIDQVSKIVVRRALETGDELPLVPGWIHLSHVLNHGAAWGMLTGQRPLLIVIAAGVIAAVVWLAREQASRGPRSAIGFGLILGGAIGNLIDRILFGAVTDFLDLDTSLDVVRTFPVFNGADSALTIGVILLLSDLLFDRRPR